VKNIHPLYPAIFRANFRSVDRAREEQKNRDEYLQQLFDTLTMNDTENRVSDPVHVSVRAYVEANIRATQP
jgi:hypothetical protein